MRRQKGTGTIYWDRSSKCDRRRTVREHNCWRAEIGIAGKRHRARFRDYYAAEVWLCGMVAEAELLRSHKRRKRQFETTTK